MYESAMIKKKSIEFHFAQFIIVLGLKCYREHTLLLPTLSETVERKEKRNKIQVFNL